MKKLLLSSFFLLSLLSCTNPRYTLDQLQGAWWSDVDNPTADFFIDGDKVWLDYDSEFHPCRIEGDILIFDLGEEIGLVKNKIISFEGDHLVLTNQQNQKK